MIQNFAQEYANLVRKYGLHLAWTAEGKWDIADANPEEQETHLTDVCYGASTEVSHRSEATPV